MHIACVLAGEVPSHVKTSEMVVYSVKESLMSLPISPILSYIQAIDWEAETNSCRMAQWAGKEIIMPMQTSVI